jgi:hypothetical protein
MLTLAEASVYFDRTEVRDPDSGRVLFHGQVDPYDDSKRDSVSAYRRILSVAPGTAMPARRAVRIFGQAFLVGNQEVDGLQDPHRVKYVLQPCARKMSFGRPGDFLAGLGSAQELNTWAALEWVKDSKEPDASTVSNQYNALFAARTDVRAHDVLWDGGDYFLALSSRELPSGFLAVEACKLEPPIGAGITQRTYSHANGGFTVGATNVELCLRVRWQDFFRRRLESAQAYRPGDQTLLFAGGIRLDTSAQINLGDSWQVVAVDTAGGAVAVHARPAWAM